MTMSDDDNMPLKIKYQVGKVQRELAIWAEDMEEAKDFAHLSLRTAVQELDETGGSAEIFHLHTNKKFGKMAVLFDTTGPLSHEQWTWISEEKKKHLH
jgi:hypothetical protein